MSATAQTRDGGTFTLDVGVWFADRSERPVDTNTLLIIVLIVLLLGGGGFFYRRRGV